MHKPAFTDRRYILQTLALTLLIVPAAIGFTAWAGITLKGVVPPIHAGAARLFTVMLVCLIPVICGIVYARSVRLPRNFYTALLPLLAPLAYYIALWTIAIRLTEGNFAQPGFDEAIRIASLPFVAFFAIGKTGNQYQWLCLLQIASSLLLAGSFLMTARHDALFRAHRGISVLLVALVAGGVFLGMARPTFERNKLLYTPQEIAWPIVSENLYRTFQRKDAIMLPETERIRISEPLPRIGVVEEFAPVAASIVWNSYAVQPERKINMFIRMENAETLWNLLLQGEVDLILVPAETRAHPEHLLLDIRQVPFARDAFVFLLDPDNPVQDLTRAQIRAIYSGHTAYWRPLDETTWIMAFQRPEMAASQHYMRSIVMLDAAMRPPLLEKCPEDRLPPVTADFRVMPNALGYTFRHVAERAKHHATPHYPSMDGVEPSPENIRTGRYPFIRDIHLAVRSGADDNVQALVAWMTGKEGSALVEAEGYISLSVPPGN